MKTESIKTLLLFFFVVISLQIIIGFLTYLNFETMQERGTFGDMFGAVNSLFSGLAFAGIIFTILLQKKELELQRKELELTRAELAKSAEAQQTQSKILEKQLKITMDNYKFELEKESQKAQPLLIKPGGSFSGREANWNFINIGSSITEVEVVPKGNFDMKVPKVFPNGEKVYVTIGYDTVPQKKRFRFEIFYLDGLGKKNNKEYEYSIEEGTLVEIISGKTKKA